MTSMTVHNIEEVLASLQAQAKANHCSLEYEIRHVLAQQASAGHDLRNLASVRRSSTRSRKAILRQTASP